MIILYSISDSPISNILHSTWTAERCECSTYFSIHSAHSLHKIVAYSIKDLSQISMDLWIHLWISVDLCHHSFCWYWFNQTCMQHCIHVCISGTPLTAKLKAVFNRILKENHWLYCFDTCKHEILPRYVQEYRLCTVKISSSGRYSSFIASREYLPFKNGSYSREPQKIHSRESEPNLRLQYTWNFCDEISK